MIMTIGNFAFSSVFKKKCDRLYTILQKMVGYTQRPWVRQKKKFSPTLVHIKIIHSKDDTKHY
jgi:hypothetical protein